MTRSPVETTSRNILKRINPDLADEVIKLRAEGLSVRRIAELLPGLNKSTVHRFLQEMTQDDIR